MSQALQNVISQRNQIRGIEDTVSSNLRDANNQLKTRNIEIVGSLASNAVGSYLNIKKTLNEQEYADIFSSKIDKDMGKELNLQKDLYINGQITEEQMYENVNNKLTELCDSASNGKGGLWKAGFDEFKKNLSNEYKNSLNKALPEMYRFREEKNANDYKNGIYNDASNGTYADRAYGTLRTTDVGNVLDWSESPEFLNSTEGLEHFKMSLELKNIDTISESVDYIKEHDSKMYKSIVSSIKENGGEATEIEILNAFNDLASIESSYGYALSNKQELWDANYRASHGNKEYADVATEDEFPQLCMLMNISNVSAKIKEDAEAEGATPASIKPAEIESDMLDPFTNKTYGEIYTEGQIWNMNNQIQSAWKVTVENKINNQAVAFSENISGVIDYVESISNSSSLTVLPKNPMESQLAKVGIDVNWLPEEAQKWVKDVDTGLEKKREGIIANGKAQRLLDKAMSYVAEELLSFKERIASRDADKALGYADLLMSEIDIDTQALYIGKNAGNYRYAGGDSPLVIEEPTKVLSNMPKETTQKEYEIQWTNYKSTYLTENEGEYEDTDEAKLRQAERENLEVSRFADEITKGFEYGEALNINSQQTFVARQKADGTYECNTVFDDYGATRDILIEALDLTGFYEKFDDGSLYEYKNGKYHLRDNNGKDYYLTEEELLVQYNADIRELAYMKVEEEDGELWYTNIESLKKLEKYFGEYSSNLEARAESVAFDKYSEKMKNLQDASKPYSAKLSSKYNIQSSDIDAEKVVNNSYISTLENFQKSGQENDSGVNRVKTSQAWDNNTSRKMHYVNMYFEQYGDDRGELSGKRKYNAEMILDIAKYDSLLSEEDYKSLTTIFSSGSQMAQAAGNIDSRLKLIYESAGRIGKDLFGSDYSSGQKDFIFDCVLNWFEKNAENKMEDTADMLSNLENDIANRNMYVIKNLTSLDRELKDYKGFDELIAAVNEMYTDYSTSGENPYKIVGFGDALFDKGAATMMDNSTTIGQMFNGEATKDWTEEMKYAVAMNYTANVLGLGDILQFDLANFDKKRVLEQAKEYLAKSGSRNLILTMTGMIMDRKNKYDEAVAVYRENHKGDKYVDSNYTSAYFANNNFDIKTGEYVIDGYKVSSDGKKDGKGKIVYTNEDNRVSEVDRNFVSKDHAASASRSMTNELARQFNSEQTFDLYQRYLAGENMDWLLGNSATYNNNMEKQQGVIDGTGNSKYYNYHVRITQGNHGVNLIGFEVYWEEADSKKNPIVKYPTYMTPTQIAQEEKRQQMLSSGYYGYGTNNYVKGNENGKNN